MANERRDFVSSWPGEYVGKGEPFDTSDAEAVSLTGRLEAAAKAKWLNRSEIEADWGWSLEKLISEARKVANQLYTEKKH